MIRILKIFFLLVGLSSCGQHESGGGGGSSKTARDLIGSWRSSCLRYGESEFQMTSLTHQDGRLSRLREVFPDSGCSEGQLLMKTKAEGIYEVPEEGLLDLTYQEVRVTVLTTDKQTWLKGECPTLEFPLNQEIDVATCSAFTSSLTTTFDIFEVDGDNLYLAKTAQLTKEARPTALDYERPYTRIN